MKYTLRFKPRSLRDLKKLPTDRQRRVIEKALADYHDLQALRTAKQEEERAPTLSLSEVKAQLELG